MPIRVRDYQESDLAQLALLEAHAVSHAWSEAQYRSSWRSGHWGWVVEVDGHNGLAALAIVMPVLDEAELLNIVVHPDCQRRGLGQLLMTTMTEALKCQHFVRLHLEVRAGNVSAIRLYQANRFVESGCRANYYPALAGTGREDALLMALDLAAE